MKKGKNKKNTPQTKSFIDRVKNFLGDIFETLKPKEEIMSISKDTLALACALGGYTKYLFKSGLSLIAECIDECNTFLKNVFDTSMRICELDLEKNIRNTKQVVAEFFPENMIEVSKRTYYVLLFSIASFEYFYQSECTFAELSAEHREEMRKIQKLPTFSLVFQR